MFYVYEWFIKETNEVIYVGKGTGRRYKVRKHNRFFNDMINRYECDSRIVKEFSSEDDAFRYENRRIAELKSINQCVCNIYNGGTGGTVSWWTDELREEYSRKNVMKSEAQRKRMIENNPMKDINIAKKNGAHKKRKVVIDGAIYESLKEAAASLDVREYSISTWCKRGYDTKGNPCRYFDEPQKEYPLIKKTHPNATTPKAVIVDGIRYETVKDAATAIGVWSESIIRAIKENRMCKGHECRYDNQQPSRENSENSIPEGSTTNG